MFINKIYEHLVTYSVDPNTVNDSPGGPYSGGYGAMIPALAASWETASDGLTWTFHLQPNVTWSDGTPLTSADVAFSLALCLNPKAGGCTYAGGMGDIAGAAALKAGTASALTGVTTPDAQTVVIKTDHPNAALADGLANIWILQKASVSQIPLDPTNGLNKDPYWFTPGKAIGTGPFKLSGYTAGQFMELSRNDSYWRGKPLLDKIVRKEYKDAATALLAFDKGEVDYTYLTADEVEREKSNANAVILPGPSQGNNAVVFNPKVNPAFANKLFRQAMEYAIDRQAIIANLYGGGAQALSCLFGNPAYHGTENTYDYNPDKAKALLQEAGIDPTTIKDITFDTYYNDPLSLNVMTAIQANWAAVGFNVKIQQMDGAAWVKRYYDNGASQVSFLGAANGPDGNIAATYFLSTSAWPNGNNGWKDYHYSNAQVDDLINKGASVFDTAARSTVYQQLCSVLADDIPWNVLWTTTRYWIVNKRVGNIVSTPGPGTGTYYDAAEKWFIKS